MLQLQMTGYMLRNAEYVMTLRKLLQLKTRSPDELREAFDRLDLDKSGYIETAEVEELLRGVYEDGVPPLEVAAFVKLFDADGDGKIAWEEFAAALGALDTPNPALPLLSSSTSADTVPSPQLSGNVTVQLDDGTEVEMDANAYMNQLKEEALALRTELNQFEQQQQQQQLALSNSISAYVSSLPEAQLKVLTSGISDDVVTAMRQLVTYILRSPSGDAPPRQRCRGDPRAGEVAAALPLPARPWLSAA